MNILEIKRSLKQCTSYLKRCSQFTKCGNVISLIKSNVFGVLLGIVLEPNLFSLH